MSSWIKVYAENEDMQDVNSFVVDLQSLLEKHDVWMNVEESADDDFHVVEFNHNGSDEETDWWVEMIDLWPNSAVTMK